MAFKPIQYGEYASPTEPASTGASLAWAQERRQALCTKRKRRKPCGSRLAL